MVKYFRPHSSARGINVVDPVVLRARGIRGAIVDLDNTLVGFHAQAPLAEDALWVQRAHAAGVQVVVLTNNGTPWAWEIARTLAVPCIARARKPLPFGSGVRCAC